MESVIAYSLVETLFLTKVSTTLQYKSVTSVGSVKTVVTYQWFFLQALLPLETLTTTFTVMKALPYQLLKPLITTQLLALSTIGPQ